MSEITPEAVKTARDAATPGPWAWRQHTTDGIEDVLEPYMCQSEGFIEVSGPNSRLIAMAPDLATAYLAQAEELAAATALAEKLERAVGALTNLDASCHCHEAYSGRRMQDPDCPAGEYGDIAREGLGLPPVCQYNKRLAAIQETTTDD